MPLADAINVCPLPPEVARYPHIAESLKLAEAGWEEVADYALDWAVTTPCSPPA